MTVLVVHVHPEANAALLVGSLVIREPHVTSDGDQVVASISLEELEAGLATMRATAGTEPVVAEEAAAAEAPAEAAPAPAEAEPEATESATE